MKMLQPATNWLIVGLGILAGILIGLLIGFWLGIAFIVVFMPHSGLEAFIPLILSTEIGIVAGGIAGLRISRILTRRLGVAPALGLPLALILVGLILIYGSMKSLQF
ncbi:MAG TPA: hypothetical protein VGD69_07260 [Herpetosiphonaceae bacterium]